MSTIAAESEGEGDVAGASLHQRVVILNPLVPALVLILVGVFLTILLVRRRASPGAVLAPTIPSAASPPPTAPGELPSAHLVSPKPVGPLPAIFDPALDPELVFNNDWGPDVRLQLDEQTSDATLQAERIALSIASVPLGLHRLDFMVGREKVARFTFHASPYHPPVEQSGRALVGRVRGKPLSESEPTRMSAFIDELAQHRVPFDLANEFRNAYEEALYAGRDCSREQFARYFQAYYEIDAILRNEVQTGRVA